MNVEMSDVSKLVVTISKRWHPARKGIHDVLNLFCPYVELQVCTIRIWCKSSISLNASDVNPFTSLDGVSFFCIDFEANSK